MSRPHDVFLSHSGEQKDYVELLFTELSHILDPMFRVYFDKKSVPHGEQVALSILEGAKSCKLAVAVLSEEYFTRSKWPMVELAASYSAAKENGHNGLPRLFPVFLAITPDDAKNYQRQKEWEAKWKDWATNEAMGSKRNHTPRRVYPKVWTEALHKLLEISGPIYKPNEYQKKPALFLKKAAQLIAERLEKFKSFDLSGGMVSHRAEHHSLQPAHQLPGLGQSSWIASGPVQPQYIINFVQRQQPVVEEHHEDSDSSDVYKRFTTGPEVASSSQRQRPNINYEDSDCSEEYDRFTPGKISDTEIRRFPSCSRRHMEILANTQGAELGNTSSNIHSRIIIYPSKAPQRHGYRKSKS